MRVCALRALVIGGWLMGSMGVLAESPEALLEQQVALTRRQLEQSQEQLREANIRSLIYKIELQVSTMRAFRTARPMESRRLTPEQLERLLEESLRQQYPGAALDHWVWLHRLFGTLPAELDLVEMMKGLLGEQALGAYDPESGDFFVGSRFPLDSVMGKMVLAHEITHALQDQNYGFERLEMAKAGNDDRSMALLSLAEGDATLLMTEYILREGEGLGLLLELPGTLMMDQQQLQQAPEALQQLLLFPYLQGVAFFQALEGRTRVHPDGAPGWPGDPAWRNSVWWDPPTTTEQIIHPEKYLTGEQPESLELTAPADWTTTSSNTLGEFGIRVLLDGRLERDVATRAAAGWDGDRVILGQRADGGAGLIWLARWDSAVDAEEFLEAAGTALKAADMGEDVTWTEEEDRLVGQSERGQIMLTRPQRDAVRIDIGLEREGSPGSAEPAGLGAVAQD